MSVQIKNTSFPTDTKYQQIFDKSPFELSDFQKWAIKAIHERKNTLITAFTGSGKTLPAEEAIRFYHNIGLRSIYCSPVKALTNEKYDSFRKKFSEISFGIFTGDNKDNPEADCLLMTTEILANNLNRNNNEIQKGILDFNINYNTELGVVIFDEFQYLFSDRGSAWNDCIVNLPKSVPIVALSATMSNPENVCKWLSKVTNKDTYLCPNYKRVVPLEHYAFLTLNNHGNIKKMENEDKMFVNDLIKKPLVLKKDNIFTDKTPSDIIKFKKILKKNRIYMKKQFVLNEIAKYMKNNNDLPAIIFTYSRKGCYNDAASINTSLFEKNSNIPHIIAKECKTILTNKLQNWKEYIELPEYKDIIKNLQRGVAVHHSGVHKIFREMIEILFAKKMIPLLFATETFAVGINMPVKTAVFTALQKYSNNGFRYLTPDEYTQQSGRAGRRGIDKIGKTYHLPQLFNDNKGYLSVNDYRTIVNGGYVAPVSKINLDFNFLLKCLNDEKNIESHIDNSYIDLDYLVFCNSQKEFYLKILEKERFIDENKKLTQKGLMAIQFQEIPSVAFADFFIKQKNLLDLISPKEFITLFSIFTNIRLPDEDRVHNYETINISDNCKALFKKITGTLNFWTAIEADFGHNCDQYKIQYDLAEIIYKWGFVKDESDAIQIFQELDYWGIFIGDFVKAVLKINTIADEVKKVGILIEDLALVEKMSEISSITLKSIVTNTSLYL
tara:strand:+ start:4705 stop:6879 length:2175 start_codon:yes stop_codon:yes gene_type:complete